MARKKKQDDNTSDNIQKTINDASVSEKKTSQKRARSKVDASTDKKPEISELEDRLGLSIDYNEEENVITLTPNRPLSNFVSSSVNSTSSLRRRPLDANAEFVVEGDEVPDYVFGSNDVPIKDNLELINRCELYLIGREFTPTIVESLWEPTDDDRDNDYKDMEDCLTETFNNDAWNSFIYSKSGRCAVVFNELVSGTFFIQCAAAEYAPGEYDEYGNPIKRPMKDPYGRQMYRKVYFNGLPGQFPRINISSYKIKDSDNPTNTNGIAVQYDKYQYVTNEFEIKQNNQLGYKYIVWPQRKVTIHLLNLNFTVEVIPLWNYSQLDVKINYNRSSNGQIIEIYLPELYSEMPPKYDDKIVSPIINMPLKLLVNQTPTDLRNVYRYAYDTSNGLNCWGGELNFRVEPEYCAPTDEDGEVYYSDVSLYVCAKRKLLNNPPNDFERIFISDLTLSGLLSSYSDGFNLKHIDRDVDVYITPVRKNYTKKFIIMTDGNVIVSDKTQLNDYLGLYTDEQIEEMNTPDRIVVGYQNTIGFLTTNSEWPWNLLIDVRPSIAQDVDGLRLKLIGRYDDGENENYINYIAYKANPKIEYNWDDSSLLDSSTIDNITGTVTHEYQFEHGDEHTDSSYIESYITYDVSIGREALDESWERLIFYLAFETIPKFNSISLKLFAGYNPNVMQIRTLSRTEAFDSNDFIQIGTGDDALWSMQYTTQRADMDAENHLVFKINASELLNLNYSHIYISDNAATFTDYDVINDSGETTLTFNGRLYNNMSIYVRPLPSVKIVFYPVDSQGASISVDGIFTLTYNGSALGWGAESTWTSESGGNISFSVARVTGSTTIYTRVLGTTNYNHHTSLTDRIAVSESHAADLTIIGVGNPDPTVSPCVVTVKFLQTFTIEAYIDRTQVLSNWPAGVTLKIKDDEIKLSNGDVVQDTNPDITTEGITHYTFGDVEVETLYANTGTSKLEVINTFGSSTTLPFRRLHISAQIPSDGYNNLCTDEYVPTTQDIDNIQIQYTKELHMRCEVEMFQATNYTLTYECAVNSKLKIIAYQPPRGSSWPTSMPDTLPSGWTRVCRSGSSEDTWTPGTDHSASYTSNQLMPILCFRIMQPLEDEDEHQEHLDFYNKLTVVLNVVDRTTGSSVPTYGATFYHQFKLYSPTDHAWCFDFYPSMSTTAIDAFKASNNGKYDFTIKCTVMTDYDINIYIKKISYQKNEMPATAGEQPGWADETLNQDSEEITALIPGNRYTGNDDENIQIFAYVPGGINPTLNGRKLRLQFCDTNASSLLSKMYPLNTEIVDPTKTGGTNMWRFNIQTKRTDIWAESADKTPTGHNYTSFSEYVLHLTYEDPAFEGALYTKTYKFHIQPVFKVWWSSNGYSFDNDGKAILYIFNHYTDLDNTHISGLYPNHPEEPPMNFPTMDQEYTSSSWPSNCVVQPSGGTSDMRYIYRGTEVVAGSGTAYKIEVTGGYEFSGTVTMKATVLNRTTSCSLRNTVTFSNITWWNGSSMTSASNMTSAYLSPVTRFGTSGNPTNVLSMTAVIDPTAAASLDLDSATLTCGLNCGGRITCSAIHPASGTNLLSLSVTVDFSSSEHPEYGAQKIDDWNLSKRNNGHPELSDYASMLYTGRPIPFTLSIDDFSYTFYVKLGPVLFIWVNNTTGGELKPHTGQEHVVRARAREWYSLDGGVTVKDTGNYYGTGEDTSYTDREYYAKFEYYNGSTYSEIPNVPPSSSSIKSQRTGNGFNVVAPTTWIDYTQSPPHPYEDDWGAWRIAVTDESHATESGKMRVTMQVTNHGTPTHSVLNWYPINATALEVNVRDFMTVSGIHFWIGRSDGAKHGAMKFEESVMPPIEPVGTSSAIDIYLAFADTSLLDIDSATITTPYSATISIEKDTTGGQITTQVGSQTYTNVHWDLLIKAKVTTNLDTYNLDNGYTYYTGLPIQFNLSISGTGSSTGYSTPFEIPLGPVIALHGDTPNSSNPPHTDSATLKPIAGNQCISQTRGHEWYMGSDNAIHMTSNGNVNNDTEQSHTWNVTWSFNGTNLTATSSPDSGYNRQFAYPNNASPCIKIQHPASWTETDGSSHPSDSGAWLISILNTTDPATGLELNGTLVGTVTVTDENSSIPVYKKVHNWYPAKDTTYGIFNVGIQKIVLCSSISNSSANPTIANPQTIWQASDGGTIKLPASLSVDRLIIFANIPQHINDEVNSSTWASKVHILPGNNNLYSYRLSGTNSRFYLDVWPWYTKKLNATGRSTHNATHYVAVSIGSIYDNGEFGRADAEGYWIAKNANASKPYQIKIVTSDTEIQPDDASGTVYTFNYILDDVIDLKVGTNTTDGYKVLGVHLNESTTIRVWHTQITNATQRTTGSYPNYTVPDELITSSNITFTDGSGNAIHMPSTVAVEIGAYQQDSETHLYYVDVTLRNTANMPDYENMPTTMLMKVTINRRSVTRVFYLAYACLEEALLREESGTEYEYNWFWQRGDGDALGLPCVYNSDVDLELDFSVYPGGSAGAGHEITSIKFDYPGTSNDELGNIFSGSYSTSNNHWIGPSLPISNRILNGMTTRNGYHLGSYEEYNIVITTADNHKYILKFSLPTLCIFNGIEIPEPECRWETGGQVYGLFIPEHGNEFVFTFRHLYKQWSTTSETYIDPLPADKLTSASVKFYLCNSSHEVISETSAIEVRSIGYQSGVSPSSSPALNAFCNIKLVNPPASEAMYKVVVTNTTCPSWSPYIYEDDYLATTSIDTGKLRFRQLVLYCFGGG